MYQNRISKKKFIGDFMDQYNLDSRDIDTKKLAQESLQNRDLFSKLMKGLRSSEKTERTNSLNVLMILSENNGEFLYPHWDYFHEMLKRGNSYDQYVAIYLLASLTSVDIENKFEIIFDEYYGILAGDKTMTASHVVLNSAKIASNKPELKSLIIEKLINTDNTFKGIQKDLIKVYAIETLRKIKPTTEERSIIEDFVKSQLDNSSSRTRSAAKCYIDRCELD
jgi:hypothetical protein